MAKEQQISGLTTGQTTYYTRTQEPGTGKYLNTTSNAFEVYNVSNIALYRTNLTEDGPGDYSANQPTGATSVGVYTVNVYMRASSGAAAATNDQRVGGGTVNYPAGSVASTLTPSALLGSPRDLSAIADGAITITDALWCAVAGAAGKETIVSTTYTVKTPFTGTTIRQFTLDSATAPTSRT